MSREEAAYQALAGFRRASGLPRNRVDPFLINTGRLLELSGEGPFLRVDLYEGGETAAVLEVECGAVVEATARDYRRYLYRSADRAAGCPACRLDIRGLPGGQVRVYAAEKAGPRWRPRGATTRGGVLLADAEWARVVEFAGLWAAYVAAAAR